MTTRRILGLVFGVLGQPTGVAVSAGAVWLPTEDRDGDGFHVAEAHRFERSSHAIVSGDLDILTDGPSWLAGLAADPVDLRIDGDGDGDDDLFLGIAPTANVDRYLSGVAHDEITEVDFDGRSIADVGHVSREGTSPPTAPGGVGRGLRPRSARATATDIAAAPETPPVAVTWSTPRSRFSSSPDAMRRKR